MAERMKIDFERANAISRRNEEGMPKIPVRGNVDKLLEMFYEEHSHWKTWQRLTSPIVGINHSIILKEFFSGGRFGTLEKEMKTGFTHAEGCHGYTSRITGCYFNGYEIKYSLISKDKKMKGDMRTGIMPSVQLIYSVNIDDLKGRVYSIGRDRLSLKENGVYKTDAWCEANKLTEEMTGELLPDRTDVAINYIRQKSALNLKV